MSKKMTFTRRAVEAAFEAPLRYRSLILSFPAFDNGKLAAALEARLRYLVGIAHPLLTQFLVKVIIRHVGVAKRLALDIAVFNQDRWVTFDEIAEPARSPRYKREDPVGRDDDHKSKHAWEVGRPSGHRTRRDRTKHDYQDHVERAGLAQKAFFGAANDADQD